MEELRKTAADYMNGFITPLEFIMAYRDQLAQLGANKPLEDAYNDTLAPLAQFLCGILGGSGKDIWEYNNQCK